MVQLPRHRGKIKTDKFPLRAVFLLYRITADFALEKAPDIKIPSSTWRNMDGQNFSIGLIIAVGIRLVALSEQRSIPECRLHQSFCGRYRHL